MDLHNYRDTYNRDELLEKNLPVDPLILFSTWMDQAIESNIQEPNAISLATATLDGRPSVRMVLLKHFSSDGFIFYTNYKSRKGGELNQNPSAAFNIWWPPLQRQVRVEGEINRLSVHDSKRYFDSRPEGSRRGAIVSPQSEVIPGRSFLEHRLEDCIKSGDLSMPSHWGGFILKPDRIEFWQGRDNRLHDRIIYEAGEAWQVSRLAP